MFVKNLLLKICCHFSAVPPKGNSQYLSSVFFVQKISIMYFDHTFIGKVFILSSMSMYIWFVCPSEFNIWKKN